MQNRTPFIWSLFALITISFSPRRAAGAASVFDCSSGFANTGACAVFATNGPVWDPNGQPFYEVGTNSGVIPTLVGSQFELIPSGAVHVALNFNYQHPVNVQAFTSTFLFVPNGWNTSFILNNNTNPNGAGLGPSFSSGAGLEASFFQAYGTLPITPNKIFALELDSYDPLVKNGPFVYSSAQIYQQNENPNINGYGGEDVPIFPIAKISTLPVPLNSPANTQETSTGHTYSATVTYTGTHFRLDLYDKTAGGSCPGAKCFSYIWSGVNIPSLVGGVTAYVGLAGGTNTGSTSPLYVNGMNYTVLSMAATPSVSPAAGTYSGTQSVTIADSSSGAILCYNTTGSPATNGTTGCANGTLYTGALSVSSGQTIYAVAGGTGYGDSPVIASAYKIGSTASQPTFSPSSGTYNGIQTVMISAAQGGVICYNTTGSPALSGSVCASGSQTYSTPITVSSNETLYAIAGGTGLTTSSVGSAAYIINPFPGAAPANSPTYSPLPGTYPGTQSVTLHSTTANSNICYTLAASPPTLLPQTDNEGGCITGTPYTGPVSVSSSQTLYAMASTTHLGPPSSLTVGAFVIGTGTPPPPPPSAGACDMNRDGAVNAADVQSAVNQALGIATCGTADLQSNGQCTAVDVQRVVNSVLGGQCVVGP